MSKNQDLEKGIISNDFASRTIEDVQISRSSSTMFNQQLIRDEIVKNSFKNRLLRFYHANSNLILILVFLLAPGLYVLLTGYEKNTVNDGIEVITWTAAISISTGLYIILSFLLRFFVRFARDNLIRSEDYNRVARIQQLMPYFKIIIFSISSLLVFIIYVEPKTDRKSVV